MKMRKLGYLALGMIVVLAMVGCQPAIISVSPTSPVTMRANTAATFTVNATGTNLSYTWTLDGVLQTTTTQSFTYSPATTDLGPHTLKVTVFNTEGSVSAEWKISVVLMAFAWQESYGGSGDDVATAVQQTADGGYILAGYSNSTNLSGTVNHGEYDVYLVRLDAAGNIQWQALYGGSGADKAYAVALTSDGGFLVAGLSTSQDITGVTNHGGSDFYVIKLTSAGVIEWQAQYGGSGNDYARALQITRDGATVIAGDTSASVLASDGRLLKLTPSGAVTWERTYDTGAMEFIYGLKETADDSDNATGFILTGSKNALSGWVVRTDISGAILWQDTYGGYPILGCNLSGVQQIDDGGFVVTGGVQKYDEKGNNKPDACTLKYSTAGARLWESLTGGISWDAAAALEKIPGGIGFVLTGMTQSDEITDDTVIQTVGDFDVYIGVLGADGSCIYQERRGGLDLDDGGNAIVNTYSGGSLDGFVIAGQKGIAAAHDIYLLRYDMSE